MNQNDQNKVLEHFHEMVAYMNYFECFCQIISIEFMLWLLWFIISLLNNYIINLTQAFLIRRRSYMSIHQIQLFSVSVLGYLICEFIIYK